MLIYFLLPLIAVALLCVPFIFTAKKIKNGRSPKGAFIGNLCTFAGIMLCALIVPVGNFVSAASEEGVKAALSTGAGLGPAPGHGRPDVHRRRALHRRARRVHPLRAGESVKKPSHEGEGDPKGRMRGGVPMITHKWAAAASAPHISPLR